MAPLLHCSIQTGRRLSVSLFQDITMPSLGDTTAMLARLRRTSFPTSDATGRLNRIDDFGANPGQLTMLGYRPEGLAPDSPLVVVLHGCTQTAAAYAEGAGWLDLADRMGFMVVAPQQPQANNAGRCFNWFLPGDIRRGEGEAASIAAMVAHAVETHDLDRSRVFVTGLSAGGAMTAVMLAVYPDLFAGGAVIAGLPYGVASNVQGAMQVMNHPAGRSGANLAALVPVSRDGGSRPRLSIWHGDADGTVQVKNGHDLAQQWAALNGLPSAPHRVEPLPHGTRSIWRSADGEPLVELNIVRGLGHGTPLSTKRADDVGRAGPFMLEAGISSSLEIARFWNIDGGERVEPGALAMIPATPQREGAAKHAVDPEPVEASGLGQGVMHAIGHVPAGVQEVIAKALRAAGLLK
ncbi:esterase [Caulobacter endophyticus]|uniref:Esterase n=2 Tax=Caulobacter endophyticus TaxID=2172652 RepID=A0A2T9K9S0_9CAUL|nr:esterase [Caulobacter endophyticus]